MVRRANQHRQCRRAAQSFQSAHAILKPDDPIPRLPRLLNREEIAFRIGLRLLILFAGNPERDRLEGGDPLFHHIRLSARRIRRHRPPDIAFLKGAKKRLHSGHQLDIARSENVFVGAPLFRIESGPFSGELGRSRAKFVPQRPVVQVGERTKFRKPPVQANAPLRKRVYIRLIMKGFAVDEESVKVKEEKLKPMNPFHGDQ